MTPEPDTARRQLTAKGEATRARLLAVAGEMLAREGRIEIAAVAEAAEISQGAMYRYFDGRDSIVAAVVEEFYDAYEAEVFDQREVPGDSWMEKEALRIDREVEFFYGHPLGRAIACGMLREPSAAAIDMARTRRHGETAGRNIARGRRNGELPDGTDPGLAGAAIIGSVRSLLAEALSREQPPPPEEVAKAALDVGRAMLFPDHPPNEHQPGDTR